MSLQIIKGQTGYVDPASTIRDTGWSADGIYAYHTPCNQGEMNALVDFGLQIGRNFVFEYIVDQYVSGGVTLIAGDTFGTERSAAGTYTETLFVTGSTGLHFFSDGELRIHHLTFYDELLGPQSGRTLTFNERANKWVQEWSWQSEIMIKFIDKLFGFLDGTIWQFNTNPVMNTFFGTKYPAEVTFISNQDYEKSKLWFNMRMDSTGNWYAPSLVIPANDQFPNGMESVLTSKNIKSIDGKLWADILRDFTDPNFAYITDPALRKANALFRGRMMQGGYLVVTLRNDDTTAATLSSVEIYYVDVQKSL